jgi:hypothetical protein
MNHSDYVRDTEPSGSEVKAAEASRGIADAAWPWIAGLFGVLTALLYRETLRVMEVARSLNW